MIHLSLRVSLVALTVLATTAAVSGLQANAQQKPSAAPTALQHADLPQWAFTPDPPEGPPRSPQELEEPRHVPGSTKAYAIKEVNGTSAVDWFPDQHPKAPAVVMDGKMGVYQGCGSCHLMNGASKPDMQNLNGMPVAYMHQQLEDMKNDLRTSSVADPGALKMVHVAKSVSLADEKEALAYFHSIGPLKWIRVVETDTVPKSVTGLHRLPILDPGGATEPLGNRILEAPENYDRAQLRDPTSSYIAYVPAGSVAKGEAIVKTGAGGHTMACIACHGTDLRGMGDTMPTIAGRSPSATARQLYDFKTGARHGQNSPMMKPVVDRLTDEDIVNITAYLASLPQ